MGTEDDADLPPAQQPHQPLLSVAEGQGAEILTVELQQVEDVQHSLADRAATMQSIEDGDAVRTG